MKYLIAIALLGISVKSNAAVIASEQLANETALAYSTNFDFYVNSVVDRRLSASVVYTSATPTAVSFTDGAVSTGSLTVSATSYALGQFVTINGYKFVAGSKYVVGKWPDYTSIFPIGNTFILTAINIANAIQAHPINGPLLNVSTTGARVDLTSRLADGVAYTIASSSASQFTVGGTATGGGTAASVFGATDKIYSLAHTITTGLPVLYTSNQALTNLTAGTTYYGIRSDANNVKLATTQLNAIGGTAIDIGGVPIGSTAHTMAITPLAITGTPSFKWQASNDGSNWVDVNTSSITMSAYTYGGTTSAWDFEWFNFRWIRLAVTGPTTGGIYLNALLNKKE